MLANTSDAVPSTLKFVASVALRFDTPRAIGETADGVRFDFTVHGDVTGPTLHGKFPPCAAYLLIDRDGIGTIQVRAPLLLHDGAIAELEATGRYDFGEDGYQRAAALDLPNSALGWCPRFLTGDSRYLWLNRALFVGVGELRPRETRVDYDLFMVLPRSVRRGTLYERLGGRIGIREIMSTSIDSLHANEQLRRQNPKLASSVAPTQELKEHVTDFVCRLTGGPNAYRGRSLRASHAHLDITEADWRVSVEDTYRVLDECGVPRAEQEELIELLETIKPEIVRV